MKNVRSVGSPIVSTLCAAALIMACSTTGQERAAQGAGQGAAAGAVGGLISSVIFGGNPLEAAARGAVWGGSVGAVGGAIQGDQEHTARQQREAAEEQARRDAELAGLKREIGDDTYAGLEALTDCKHAVAVAYARSAAKSRNRDHALAGLWLEAITYADESRESDARSVLPAIVERDTHMGSERDAAETLDELSQGLREIRAEYGLPETCSE